MDDKHVAANPMGPGRRWAYRTIEVRTTFVSGKASKLDALDEAGAAGWEAVGITSSSGNNFQVLFKREY